MCDDELEDLLNGEEEEEQEVWYAQREQDRAALLALCPPGTILYGIYRSTDTGRTTNITNFTIFVVPPSLGKPTTITPLVARLLDLFMVRGQLHIEGAGYDILENLAQQLSRELYGDIRPQFRSQWFS